MAYERFLPSFKVVEINVSLAHTIGHALAQYPSYVSGEKALVASKDVQGIKFVENGVIVGLGEDLVISNYDSAKHKVACLVYNDELVTGPIDQLDKYAEEADENGVVYLRALPLYVGDTFTTNNIANINEENAKFAKVVNGIITLQSVADGDTMFAATKTTTPNGTEAAYELVYLG